MKYFVNYENSSGKIISISSFNNGYYEIEFPDDFDFMKDDMKDIYSYKIVDDKAIKIEEQEQKELYPFLFLTENDEKYKQEEQLQQMMLASMRVSFLNELLDSQALTIPLCYDAWEDYQEGYELVKGLRVRYNDKLWRVEKTHKKNNVYYPGYDPTLYTQLDKDEHAGTKEDPIPVPDTVMTSGFEYIYGKYYNNDPSNPVDIYLCERQGIPNPEELYGTPIKLYHYPSVLVAQYFKKE